jgi:hypothetical protein
MILRRVIAHFRRQEWTAIAIDFLIVVFGVFVGLQVNNWNEARQDRKDERFYLARLHEDLVNAEKVASRMLQKRIDKRDALTSATLTLLGKSDRDTLSEAECNAVGGSHIYNLELTELSALTELRGAGRLSIMQDEGIRAALIALQQSQQVLSRAMDAGESDTVPLPEEFPDLLAANLYVVDGTDGQTRIKYVCDVAEMRGDRAFLTVLAGNAQRYDAYVRVHLEPWAAQLKKVRELVDGALVGARDIRAGGRVGQSGGLKFRSTSSLDALRPIQCRPSTPCRAASAARRKVAE